MAKGPICVTTYAMKSGEGTAMFSRPGKQTIAEYMAFKEPHDRINEEAEDIPDEVLKEQLVIDLKGEETDALKQYLQGQLEK